MKKTKNILIFLFLVLIFIGLTVFTSSDRGLNYPAYTVFSAEDKGSSLIYDVLNYLGYNVNISYEYIDENTSIDDIQFVINPSFYYTNISDLENIADWVEKGGILIFTSDGISSYGDRFVNLISSDTYDYFGRGFIYYFGMGRVYILDSIYLTNENLMENGSLTGDSITAFLDSFSHNKIYFNESYHGYSYELGFWEMLPFNFRLMVYQVLIVLIALVLFLGRRFGKAVPYYEEIQREENEYVPALANLYAGIGMGNAPIDVFRDKFIQRAKDYFRINDDETGLKEIYEYWKTYNLPEINKLEYLLLSQEKKINTKGSKGKKELRRQYTYLQKLTQIVSKKI